MINLVTIILAAAVALLAALCCMLFYAIRRKDDRLTKLTEENRRLEHEIYRLNDVLEDKDFQLQGNDELIQNLKQKTFWSAFDENKNNKNLELN